MMFLRGRPVLAGRPTPQMSSRENPLYPVSRPLRMETHGVGLPWVRLDTAFASNPKILTLLDERGGREAAFVYVCALAYCGGHGTDGYIPESALRFIHGRKRDVELLIRHRLWHQDVGGWQVNGWNEKQPSTAETQAKRKRAQDAANARWSRREHG